MGIVIGANEYLRLVMQLNTWRKSPRYAGNNSSSSYDIYINE